MSFGWIPYGFAAYGDEEGSPSPPPPGPPAPPSGPLISIRERPPLRLSVTVETPGSGPAFRWGEDDPNANNKPENLTFSTSMPGGFDQATCTLERDPRIDWPDLQELSTVTVYGLGGAQVAWQGRIEEFPSQAGSEANVTPTLVGWQSHLQDNSDAAMIYVDRNLTSWQGPDIERQINLLTVQSIDDTSGSVAASPGGTPALVTQLTGPWSRAQICESWYVAGPGLLIGSLYYAWALQASGAIGDDVTTNTNWWWQTFLSTDDISTSADASGNLRGAGPTGNGTLVSTGGKHYAIAQLLYTGASGSDGVNYPVYWTDLAVYGNHGLTGHGPNPQGFLASDVIAHAVGTWSPKIAFTTGATGTIQPSSFVIPQLVFNQTTTLAIVQQASQFELLDYAVWEETAGTTGPTLYVNARGARGRQWVSRVGQAQLQNAGPQMSRIFNGVIVQFSAVDGTTQTVGPTGSTATYTDPSLLDSDPQNPANIAGIDRWYSLTIGTSTPAAAIQIGAIFLQEQALVNTSGQASIVGHVQDTSGVWWPAFTIRAGDTIQFLDAADSSPRRVISTSYDDSSKTNALQLDSPPDTLAGILDRLSAVIAPLGLQ